MGKETIKKVLLVRTLIIFSFLIVIVGTSLLLYTSFSNEAKDKNASKELAKIYNQLYYKDSTDDNYVLTDKGIEFIENKSFDSDEEKSAYLMNVLDNERYKGKLTVVTVDGVIIELHYSLNGGKANFKL